MDLGEIKTIEFGNKIILSIDQRWIKYFDTDELTFQSSIKNGKYVLVGPEISVRPTKQNTTASTGGASYNK